MPNAGIPAFEHSNTVKMPEFPDLNTQMPEFPDLNTQMPEFPDLNKRIANLDMSESLEEL
jgi:hypothetical protein